MANRDIFEEFIGYEVKVPYRDGGQFKIARGILENIDGNFIKIAGKLGTIILNINTIERISKVNNNHFKD